MGARRRIARLWPAPDLDTLQRDVAAGTIDTVLACFPDMQGRLIGKRVSGRFFVEQVAHEMHACDYLLAVDMEMEPVPGYAAASWDLGYGDFAIQPDIATCAGSRGWSGPRWCSATWSTTTSCWRTRRARSCVARSSAPRPWVTALTATELEFYVFDEPASARQGYRSRRPPAGISRTITSCRRPRRSLIRAIRNGMEGAGIPVESSRANGVPARRSSTCATPTPSKWPIATSSTRTASRRSRCCRASASPSWRNGTTALAGSSCRIHTSLVDADGAQVFADGAGHSDLFEHYLAGQLALARDLTFLRPTSTPTSASRRLVRADQGGLERDNRTTGFRVVGDGPSLRVECRIPGADANPYLACAALLAAGLQGEQRLELEPAFAGDAYKAREIREVPKTLREALDCLDRSEALRAAFGDAVVEHYLHAGRWEQFEYDRRVTDHELIRGFERAWGACRSAGSAPPRHGARLPVPALRPSVLHHRRRAAGRRRPHGAAVIAGGAARCRRGDAAQRTA